MQSATKRQAEDGLLSRSPLHLLHRVGQRADELFLLEMSDVDITPRQFAILKAVAANEGLSQTDIVAATGIDRSTTADLVSRMLKKGLLSRRRTRDDARAYAVRLTEQGVRALQDAEPAALRVDDKLLAGLPAKRAAEFVGILNTIVGSLGNGKPADTRGR